MPRPQQFGPPGRYSREFDYLYEAESRPPAWADMLNTGVDAALGYMQLREQQKQAKAAEQEKLEHDVRVANSRANAQIAMGNAEINIMHEKQESSQREAFEKAQRDKVARDLLKRYAIDGDPATAAELAAMGTSSATLNAVRPEKKEDPEDPQVLARKRRMGTLEADKAMGVGQFKPQPATPPRPSMTPVQLRTMASGALRTAVAQAMEAYGPSASAQTTLRIIMDDPQYAELAGDPAWARELRAQVDREVIAERQRRQPKPGQQPKQGVGARAAAMNTKPPR